MSKWRKIGHIPVLIILQIVFIILFAKFVIYDPKEVIHDTPKTNGTHLDKAEHTIAAYPMFQDVHVMIFIGFGFLMTF